MSIELGDQRGVPGTKPPKEAIDAAFPPRVSQTQISGGPARLEMNTTRFPSGEYIGLSSRREDTLKGSGERAPVNSSEMRQILVEKICSVNASRFPSGESEGWPTPRSPPATGVGAA